MNLLSTISNYNRTRKYSLFIRELRPTVTSSILDAGFANREYHDTDNFLEKYYIPSYNITALGLDIHGSDLFEPRYPAVKVRLYDGKIFPFRDKCFDVGWSNAVIEHVGDEDRQLLFLKEMNRTCKAFYFTTPNRYFPFELHTRLPLLHYLPKKVFDIILKLTPLKWAAGDYMHLLSRRRIESLMSKAGIKQYRIVRNRMFGFTMDFSIIVDKVKDK
ncbi:MAG: class I SAM-dependent methyltransferase [Tannerellaceae bacterium]|jgi:SAM-dependent methyltransferase|nr:class I SAM-dependent methyltransferase [Tannerellaceae bacterium]